MATVKPGSVKTSGVHTRTVTAVVSLDVNVTVATCTVAHA